MNYIVVEEFTTHSRRFKVGDMVSENDVAGDVPLEHWVDTSRLVPAPEPDPAAQPDAG